MSLIIKYLIITSVVVFIIDYSGFINNLKRGISKILTRGKIITDEYSLKPFDCSLCTTFWTTLIYSLATNNFNLTSLLLCVLSAYSAEFIKDIFYIMKDIWNALTRFIIKKINK